MLRWHHENGKEVVPALQYIEQLEAELAELRQQVGRRRSRRLPATAAAVPPLLLPFAAAVGGQRR